jgi:hypothetical protein
MVGAAGYRTFVWVTSPDGTRKRKYVKRKTYEETHKAWLEQHAKVQAGPVSSNVPKLADFLDYWLREVVEPELAPLTVSTYETVVRLYIKPYLGTKRLDRIQFGMCAPG